MRYLLASALLLVGLTSLNAATFLDRFNALEQDLQSVQDEVQTLKDHKGGNTESSTNTSQSSNEELKALKEAIKELKTQQKNFEQRMKNLKGQPKTVSKSVGDDEEVEEDEDLDEVQEQLDELNKMATRNRKFVTRNHLKLTVDFRTAVDNIHYVFADRSRAGNDAVMTNRLWINTKYKASENISFIGQLAYYKTFGARSGTGNFSNYDNFDWISNETANDDYLRVKNAFFYYAHETFLGAQIPWTFSVGRRPSTNGHLANYRDDTKASSPIAHSINVEFDGLSSKFDLSNPLGISGFYLKFCLGRGLSNAGESLATTPYATEANSTLPNLSLSGIIVSLYNNGQYSLTTQTYQASNVIDLNSSLTAFESVGDIANFTASFIAEGIGEVGEPFMGAWLGNLLDETTFFMSYSASRTDPYKDGSMLGSTETEIGRSYWVGLQLPTLSQKGRWGVEYNEGDRYWRPITYAEDTLIGSKVAARGKAHEIYWTEPFANDSMSWQLRLTHIDYKYTGSNGFFGSNTGTPDLITPALGRSAVDTASDLRFYLRYKY